MNMDCALFLTQRRSYSTHLYWIYKLNLTLWAKIGISEIDIYTQESTTTMDDSTIITMCQRGPGVHTWYCKLELMDNVRLTDAHKYTVQSDPPRGRCALPAVCPAAAAAAPPAAASYTAPSAHRGPGRRQPPRHRCQTQPSAGKRSDVAPPPSPSQHITLRHNTTCRMRQMVTLMLNQVKEVQRLNISSLEQSVAPYLVHPE